MKFNGLFFYLVIARVLIIDPGGNNDPEKFILGSNLENKNLLVAYIKFRRDSIIEKNMEVPR